MATTNTWAAYVPDRSAPYTIDKCLATSAEEVRQHLINSGVSSLQTAVASVEGNNIYFRRPTGGVKGA